MTDPLQPGASIEEGPADWQILQQDASRQARVELRGRCLCHAPRQRVEVRVVRENAGVPVSPALDWRPARSLARGRWRATLAVPAGGLYRLETRVWRRGGTDDRPMRGDYVHHWGVGDVWLIAGQSNAAGAGEGSASDPPTLGVHQFGSDGRWKLASHPLEDATGTRYPLLVHGVAQGHSAWLAFGRRLQVELGHPIGLIPTACGGSPLARWVPGADLFENLRAMLAAAGGRARGVVWYQGESDALAGDTGDYERKFVRFVSGLRRRVGARLPIVSAQLARYRDARDGQDDAWTEMREIQRRLADRVLRTPLVPTTDLELCDPIHLSASANLVLARRFAAAVLRAVFRRPVAPPGIALARIGWTGRGRRRVRLRFADPISPWQEPIGRAEFQVRDADGPVPVEKTDLRRAGQVDLQLGRPARGPVWVTAQDGAWCGPALRDRDLRPVIAFRVRLR